MVRDKLLNDFGKRLENLLKLTTCMPIIQQLTLLDICLTKRHPYIHPKIRFCDVLGTMHKSQKLKTTQMSINSKTYR